MADTDEERQRQAFLDRLSDWSEPGAITVIRNGVPLDDTTIIESIPDRPTVIDIDEDGNLLMSDGTIVVPGGS